MANGIFDSQEMIDSLINDCNEAVKQLAGGQCIVWCATMANMAKKLLLLKNGVRDDLMNKQDQIEMLKEQLARVSQETEVDGDGDS